MKRGLFMSNKKEQHIYEPFQNMKFDNKHCFLCGVELNDINSSLEHVFPKWLQKKYDLWNQPLTLQNNTTMQYRQLTIPCCKTCNGVHLSVVEGKIKNAVNLGYDEFVKLDEKTIFQWIGKIYYGILFKELNLMDFTIKPIENKIMTKSRLEAYKMLHECLQSIHLPIQFHGFQPWSIFVVKLHPSIIGHDFNFIDSIFLSVSIQLGNIGIIANLGDNGSIKNRMKEKINQYVGIPLSEAQFIELVSEMTYHSFLLEKTPARFLIGSREPGEAYDIVGVSNSGRFKQFKEKEFSYLFKTYLELTFGKAPNNIYDPETNIRYTLLQNIDGNINVLNADGSVNNEYYLKKYGFLPNYMIFN